MFQRISFFFVVLLASLVSSCSQEAIEPLPVDTVLANAAHASRQLESVRYALDGSFSIESPSAYRVEGEGTMEGVLQEGGTLSAVSIEAELDVISNQFPIHIEGDVGLVTMPGQTYLSINEISSDVQHSLITSLQQMLWTWWFINPQAETGSVAMMPVTPDPKLMHAQSQVIRVTQRKGFSRKNGRAAYRYETMVDPERLHTYLEELARQSGGVLDEKTQNIVNDISAHGELWIDAETFVIHRVDWSIAPLRLQSGVTLSLSFKVDFEDHNVAPLVQIPTNAKPLPPSLQNLFPVGTSEESNEGLPFWLENVIIEGIFEEGS